VYDPPSSQQSEGAESEGDIENIIMNLYNKMKGLENKYIDLANFYKQELVRASDGLNDEPNPLSEGEIIRELIEEKKRLQEEMRQAIQTHNNANAGRVPTEVQEQVREAVAMLEEDLKEQGQVQNQILNEQQNKLFKFFQRSSQHEVTNLWFETKQLLHQSFTQFAQGVT